MMKRESPVRSFEGPGSKHSRTVQPRCVAKEIDWNGMVGLAMENERIRLVVIPALGGKIASLIDLKTEREWLWQNHQLAANKPKYGESYLPHLSGWDECFPSVKETQYPVEPWRDAVVPDHGEIWSLPWHAEVQSEKDKVELKTTVHGVRFPYTFERIIRMTANEQKVSVLYQVTNPTIFDLPFIWSAHPVLQVAPGMRLLCSLEDVRLYHSQGRQFDCSAPHVGWPMLHDLEEFTWDFSRLPQTETALAIKLYGRVKGTAGATLGDMNSASQIHFLFDANEITHLGIWLNLNSPFPHKDGAEQYCVAVQPCIGAQDDLSSAYQEMKDYGVLPAKGKRSWKFDVLLS